MFATASGRAVMGETPQWVIFSSTRPIAMQTRPMRYWMIRRGNCLVRMVSPPWFGKMPELAVYGNICIRNVTAAHYFIL